MHKLATFFCRAALVSFLAFAAGPLSAEEAAATDWLQRTADGKPITGLQWLSKKPELVQKPDEETLKTFLNLRGQFIKPAWTLRANNESIELDKKNEFALLLPLTSNQLEVFIEALGPDGERETETVKLAVPEFQVLEPLLDQEAGKTAPVTKTWRGSGEPRVQLRSVQLVALSVLQSGAEHSFSGLLSWSPSYCFRWVSCVRANIGATILNKATTGSFVALEYQLYGTGRLYKKLFAEVGGGAQTWLGYGGTWPMVSAGLSWMARLPLFAGLTTERFLLSYSHVFENVADEQIRAGLSILF